MTKKIIALVLALCFVFAFAACKNDKDNSDTTTGEPNTSANGETIANDESSEAESVSGDESTEAQTDASGNTVAPEETKKDNQGGSQGGNQGGSSTASKPATKAEIVAYFNKAINGVKPSAKSVTRVSETNYRSGKITGVPSIVDKLVGGIDSFVDGQLKKNSKGSETFSNSAAIKANFPVENESWSSKLTANDVASATCTEAGGVYTITIKTVADKASSNVHHGSVMPRRFSAWFSRLLSTISLAAACLSLSLKPLKSAPLRWSIPLVQLPLRLMLRPAVLSMLHMMPNGQFTFLLATEW